jgi:hypothetical protein
MWGWQSRHGIQAVLGFLQPSGWSCASRRSESDISTSLHGKAPIFAGQKNSGPKAAIPFNREAEAT